MNLVSAGLQAGAKTFSEIIFFEDKRALDEFESGHFQFGADASAVAITAAAELGAGTSGVSSEASAESSNANTSGHYFNGMAVFTICQRRPDVCGDYFGPKIYLYSSGWKLRRRHRAVASIR